MRLTERDKDNGMLGLLLAINEKSFAENERASELNFTSHFQFDEVFVNASLYPHAFALVTERDGPYLLILAVTKTEQGAGLGTALLEEIEAFYRKSGARDIKLTCSVENWKAQRLYLKMGYRAVRVIPRYYETEDGLFMRRVL